MFKWVASLKRFGSELLQKAQQWMAAFCELFREIKTGDTLKMVERIVQDIDGIMRNWVSWPR